MTPFAGACRVFIQGDKDAHQMPLIVATLLSASPAMAENWVNTSSNFCLDTDGRAVNGVPCGCGSAKGIQISYGRSAPSAAASFG